MHHCVFATLEVSGDSKIEYKLSSHDIERNWMFAILRYLTDLDEQIILSLIYQDYYY